MTNHFLSTFQAPRIFVLTALFCVLVFGSSFRPNAVSDDDDLQVRAGIAGYAQNFVGSKYRSAGRSPRTGFDCSGFVSYIMDEFGVKVSASSSALAKSGESVDLDEVLPGDLLFFGKKGRIHHVAMVTEKTAEGIFCVHSTSSRGVVVENISTSDYWRPRLAYARDVLTGENPK